MVGKDNRMTANQLKEMQANGMKIGSHTVNHEVLTKMNAEQIDYELRVSREQLKTMLGKPIYALAYPTGYVNSTVQSIAEKYYDMAFIASVIPDHLSLRLYLIQNRPDTHCSVMGCSTGTSISNQFSGTGNEVVH